MRKILFLLFIFVSILLISGTPSPTAVRYVSAWTFIPAGQTVHFSHSLGIRPLEMHAWEAPFVNGINQCLANFTAVTPVYESIDLTVWIVSITEVSISNDGQVGHCVQVIASP